MSGDRPEGLGRWEPPEDSVVLRSGWRVDPERASKGYAVALVLGAGLVGAWLFWKIPRLAPASLDEATLAILRTRHAHQAAPFVVLTVFVGLMGLGATKRCFGFDRGTLYGFLVTLAAQLSVLLLPLGVPRFSMHLGIGAGVGAFATLLALVLPWPRETKRRAVAATAFFGLLLFAWQVARARYVLRPWLDDLLGAQIAIAAGGVLGATALAIPWLFQVARTRSDGK